jgi:hypothetical protein
MTYERNFVMVRLADPKTEPVKEWLEANRERNGVDLAVLDYPGTKVLAAHKNGTVYAYMPIQPVAMLESIGPNPEAKPLEVATAVMEMVKGAGLMAYQGDFREMFFLASDKITAEGAESMGFENLTEKYGYSVFRARLR